MSREIDITYAMRAVQHRLAEGHCKAPADAQRLTELMLKANGYTPGCKMRWRHEAPGDLEEVIGQMRDAGKEIEVIFNGRDNIEIFDSKLNLTHEFC